MKLDFHWFYGSSTCTVILGTIPHSGAREEIVILRIRSMDDLCETSSTPWGSKPRGNVWMRYRVPMMMMILYTLGVEYFSMFGFHLAPFYRRLLLLYVLCIASLSWIYTRPLVYDVKWFVFVLMPLFIRRPRYLSGGWSRSG